MSEHVLTRMGRWVAALDAKSIPDQTFRAARLQVLDMIAASHAARDSHEVRAVNDGVHALAGDAGRAHVIATGARMPPVEAAMINAAGSMAHDFDDIVWMGHTGHSAVFASLAIAEHEQRTTRDLLAAVVIANEIGGRLGASSFLGPLNGQMWSFIHLVSAAAAGAWLLRLDAERTTHALAIALAQPNFALQPGFMRPGSKLLTASTPLATGMRAAYFARAGMTGEPGLVEDRRGFWARFSYHPLPAMTENLGAFWVTQTLGVKTYPGCYYFQTAYTALERIRARAALTLDTVRSISIDTTKLGCEATRFASEYADAGATPSPVNIDFDASLGAAILLHAGRFTPAEHDEGWLSQHASAIRTWQSRITVTHDPALSLLVIDAAREVPAANQLIRGMGPQQLLRLARRYRDEYRSTLVTATELAAWARAIAPRLTRARPVRRDTVGDRSSTIALPFPNRVTVLFHDGHREVEQVDLPVGSFSAGNVEAAVREKFQRAVEPALGAERARRGFDAGLALESHTLDGFVASVTANFSASAVRS